MQQVNSTMQSKSHYEILDGLRGVAALMVVLMHLLGPFSYDYNYLLYFNHGYLAVDFFFLLSGFVIGYAYDDRWSHMSFAGFAKRRLIRLHPMIFVGMLLGAVSFYGGASADVFPLVQSTPGWKVAVLLIVGCALLPVTRSFDIRGWNEMYPLNGPAWSLFYEYVANILYALFVRRLGIRALGILVAIAGAALMHLVVTSPTGDLNGGWALDATHVQIALTRLVFPFFAGLLMSRIHHRHHIRHAFLLSSALLIALFSIPRIGGSEHLWMNGLFEGVTVILLFPLIVFIGANGSIGSKSAGRISKFLGDISYPVYITHYPLVYLFNVWVIDHHISIGKGWPVALLAFIAAIAIAYLSLKLYDEPLRKWLTTRQKGRK